MFILTLWQSLAAARARQDERGASLVEYGFLLMLIAMVCFAAMQFFGNGVSHSFSSSASHVAALR